MKLRLFALVWLLLTALFAPSRALAGVFLFGVGDRTAVRQTPLPINLSNLNFEAVSTTATVTGYYVDSNGNQAGVSFTGSVTSSAVVNLGSIAAIPGVASGVYLTTTQNIYFAVTANTTDFAANPANYPVILKTSQYVAFGRAASPVAVSSASGSSGPTSNVNVTNASIPVTKSGTWNIDSIVGALTIGTFSASLPQLPSALDGSGFLKTHEQGTAAISASSLPLPTGAATSALQTSLNALFPSALDGSGFFKTHEQGTAAISAASLPLPTGASTSALQTTANNLLNGGLPAALGTGGGLKVDGSGTALPVSGTVTANAGTNLNTSALALESGGNLATLAGAVTSSKMAVKSADGDLNTLGAQADAAVGDASGTANAHLRQIAKLLGGTLTVSGSGTFTISGSVSVTGNVATTNAASSQADGHSVTLGLTTDAAVGDATGSLNAHLRQIAKTLGATVAVTQSGSWTISGTVAVTQSGTWNINNVSGTVSLPTGASTAAKQPALGTAGTAATDVITVQGIAGMTAIKVDNSGVTQPVSGTVTANQGTAAASTAGWPTTSGNVGWTTATWTSATAGNTTLAESVQGYGAAIFTIVSPGTLSGGAIATEGFDGTNWIQLPFVEDGTTSGSALSMQSSPFTLTASMAHGFRCNVIGYQQFRIRLSTVITGAGNTVILLSAQSGAPDRSVLSTITGSGNNATVTASNALKVDGSAVTQPVSGTFWQATQPVSGTVTANAGTGTFLGQVANEIPNGFTQEQGSSAGTAITDTTSHAMFAAISSKKHYLKFLMVTNSGSTASEVEVLDGSTVVMDFYVPATSGAVIPIPPGSYLIGSTNTALNIKCVTTGTNTFWTAIAYDG